MKQRFTLFLLMVLSYTIAFAGPVDLEQARAKAAKFMKKQSNGTVVLSETPEYAPARSIKGVPTDVKTPAYYVFNAEAENGYVIISGDDRTDEILGYATNGSFDLDNMPENVKAWLQGYAEQIGMLETYVQPKQNAPLHSEQWTAITPLVKTQWDQASPYNNMCPVHEGERSMTGCTATAMAQVMKYHEWPQESTTNISAYTTSTFKLNVPSMASTQFRWDEMKNKYSKGEDGDAVAELMRYCGQAIRSDYSRLSTGAYTNDVATSLKKNFKYDKNLVLKVIDYYTISEWETMIYEELEAGRPVYHAGYSLGGGHAFVCDGYDGNGMFHFNWGWSGSYDGYYKLTLMSPGTGGIGSGSSDGYSCGQEIIIGIQPPTGEAAKKKYFEPLYEQIVENTMFSYFINTHTENVTANVGFATVDEDNNIIKVLKNCGILTLNANRGNIEYKGINIASDRISLTPGTHRIATVCKAQGSTKWVRIGSAKKYFNVRIADDGSVSSITLSPVQEFHVDWQCTSNLVAGVEQKVNLTVENTGDELYTTLYLFASMSDTKGNAQSRTAVLLKEGETENFVLTFTPETYGTYNIWLATDYEGENVIGTKQVEIKKAPTKVSNLTLVSCVPDKNGVSAKVRIKNNSTEGYYREIVAILFENLYNDGRLYSTEMLTLPGDITSGSTKTFNFQFHGADSYSQCAILIGYYANHKDANYTQLGDYVWFTTGETPVDNIKGTHIQEGPVFRIDGTKVDKPLHEGIYISNGKVVIAK